MNTKHITIPAILLCMMLLTIGSAAADPMSIGGHIFWANGTPCSSFENGGGTIEITNNDTSASWTRPQTLVFLGNMYSLALDYTGDIGDGDLMLYNVSCGGETNTTAHFTYNSGGTGSSVQFNVTLDAPAAQPDLIVEDITPSGTITDFGTGNVYGLFLANESNDICAKVTNLGASAAGAFTVEFDVSGTLYTTTVSGLGAGDNTTVCITDTVARPAGTATMTIDVEADSAGVVFESSESNNADSWNGDILNNGYKGKEDYTGGSDIKTYKEFCVNGGVNYSAGDSYYLSNSGDPTWTHFNVSWLPGEPAIPSGATIVEARLYVPYCWAAVAWSQNLATYTSMTFNGNNVPMDMSSPGFSLGDYWDAKLYDPASTQYGTVVYNVTDDYDATITNMASFENTYPGNASMRGMLLVVVYDDDGDTVRRIVLNEGFDMLCAHPERYATTSEEATAWAPFAADPGCMQAGARLITFAPGAGGSGGLGEGELIFNSDIIAYDAWTRLSSTQIGVSDVDVTPYLQSTNEAGFQSNESHDWMEAMVAILEVECLSAVGVGIDPCPAFVCANSPDPACRETVNITLSGISDYGSGTIELCYDSSVAQIESIGPGDSGSVTHSPLGGNCVTISASSTDGLSGNVVFATATFYPTGNPGECTCLNLTVETLYDRNYNPLQAVVVDCCPCPSGGLHIMEDDEPWIVAPVACPPCILNDTTELRGRVQDAQCTNITNLTVHVTDATSVEAVYVDLTPLGAGIVPMTGPDGAMAGDWYYVTNAAYSRPGNPYCLDVMAVDLHGNWNNGSCITLEVLRRGDINLDNMVDMADYLIIARYTVGLMPVPDECLAGTVPADSHNGVDMADALYIAMYATLNPIPGYPAP